MAERIRVLIVDDEPAICRAVSILLTKAGYSVETALSARAAQELLGREHVDVMIVDLRMPDMRGDVLFHLATGLQPHLVHQTIFFTGDISEQAEEIVRACECPVVRKPFELREIVELVRQLAQPGSRHSA
jgi:DNA-binding NtrC family response regulator